MAVAGSLEGEIGCGGSPSCFPPESPAQLGPATLFKVDHGPGPSGN